MYKAFFFLYIGFKWSLCRPCFLLYFYITGRKTLLTTNTGRFSPNGTLHREKCIPLTFDAKKGFSYSLPEEHHSLFKIYDTPFKNWQLSPKIFVICSRDFFSYYTSYDDQKMVLVLFWLFWGWAILHTTSPPTFHRFFTVLYPWLIGLKKSWNMPYC